MKQLLLADNEPFSTYRDTARAYYQKVHQAIAPYIASINEAQAITEQLLTHYIGYTKLDHLLNKPLEITKATYTALQKACRRIQAQEPIQYILGYTDFCGRRFHVNPDVFIPRPETEEIVSYILKKHPQKNLQILDLCTGSGCIAISLAKESTQSNVDAIDNSAKALTLAKTNAMLLDASVTWHLLDILHQPIPNKKWDLIVSNPPYIPVCEQENMQPQITAYEPKEALFVPDEAPLLFYHRIAYLASQHLAPQGYLYIEIHDLFAEAIQDLLQARYLQNIQIHQDLHGKDRWMRAQKDSAKQDR